MSLIWGSNNADFSFDGFGDFNFDDLVEKVSPDTNTKAGSKLEGIKITEVFSVKYNQELTDQGTADFYDAKSFAKREQNEIPEKEKILSAFLLEKEGQKPVLLTKAEVAAQLGQKKLNIHQESADGTEVVRTFENRDITIGSFTDEQYARIHSIAMSNLSLIARQQKDIDNERKSGDKLKSLASRREFTAQESSGKKSTIGSIFSGQQQYFTGNRSAIDRNLDRLAFENRTEERRKTKELDKKSELKAEMWKSKDEHETERKEDAKTREVIIDTDR